jgi:prepilin-type processing-associated H-X9-DG protein
MKLTAYPKTIFGLALLLAWGSFALPAAAKNHDDIVFVITNNLQTVEVHTPRDSYNAVFESEVRVFPKGEASGSLTLFPTDSAHPGGANFTFGDGSVRFNRDGTVAGILLLGRTDEGEPVVVMIEKSTRDVYLKYVYMGPAGVHATWEAQGRIRVCDGSDPCTSNSPRD